MRQAARWCGTFLSNHGWVRPIPGWAAQTDATHLPEMASLVQRILPSANSPTISSGHFHHLALHARIEWQDAPEDLRFVGFREVGEAWPAPPVKNPRPGVDRTSSCPQRPRDYATQRSTREPRETRIQRQHVKNLLSERGQRRPERVVCVEPIAPTYRG